MNYLGETFTKLVLKEGIFKFQFYKSSNMLKKQTVKITYYYIVEFVCEKLGSTLKRQKPSHCNQSKNTFFTVKAQ